MDERGELVTDIEQAIAESRATLERTKHIGTPEAVMPSVESKLERWKREADELDRQRAVETARRKAEEKNDQVNASVARLQSLMADYVAHEIKASRKFIFEVMAGVVAEERAKMQKQIDALRAELMGDKSKVVDIPNVLQRRKAS
jgi:hypothetical protein